jgi:beta-phosphoglucomutase-like phosphatase (HAD superfamily)
MDGLLIDSERLFVEEWIAAAARRDIVVRVEQLTPAIGLVDVACGEVLSAAVGGMEIAREIRHEIRQRGANGLLRPPLRPGARELLLHLRAHRISCGVASSSHLAEIENRLGGHDLLRHLDAWAGGDEVARAKPDPAVYQLAASRMRVDPGQCLAFEDSDHGAEAALAAGMQVVLVPDLKQPKAELAGRCLRVVESLVTLPDWTLAQLRP